MNPTANPAPAAGPGSNETSHPQDTAGLNLPEEFWAARPILQHIRQAAHSRGRSADLVLGMVLARTAAMLPHTMRLDTGLGLASGNLYVAAIGPSGAGKTAGFAVAYDLLECPKYLAAENAHLLRDGTPLGSGEGLAEAFYGTATEEQLNEKTRDVKTVKVRKQVRHNAFMYVDEGESLTKTIERAGATIGPTLRSAWIGETLGQANAREETTRIVPRGSYSLGVVIGYQRSTAQPLLADTAAGTPQRFLWLSATDPAIPDSRTDWPGTIALHLDNDYGTQFIASTYPAQGGIDFADSIKDEVWTDNRARARGESSHDEHDSHTLLMRCKVAALLAVLDGRFHVDTQDWDLAQQVWTTSSAVRADLVAYGLTEARLRAERADQAAVIRNNRLKDGEDERERQVIMKCAQSIARKVHNPQMWKVNSIGERLGVSESQAKQALEGTKKRDYGKYAIEYAIEQGWIVERGFDPKYYLPGNSAPA